MTDLYLHARKGNPSRFTWLREAQQRQVNILAVLLLRDAELKNLEVLAADHQRASSSRGGQLLHVAHQAVKNLEDITSNKDKTNIKTVLCAVRV